MTPMRLCLLGALLAAPAIAQQAPLLPPAQAEAIAAEVSGSAAKRTVQALSLHHRMRNSDGIKAAAEIIRSKLAGYGLDEVAILQLPADGKIFYGTQRSRPAWNASFAELWEQRETSGRWQDAERVASWAEQPISLAQDSVSGRAEADLVDIGAGNPADLAGKDVRGKLVLTSSQPEAVAAEAITKGGAAGIVTWAQNQKTAWWGEDDSLIRWAHLDTWSDPTFAFAVSPARARAWQQRLARGEKVHLRAIVDASHSASAYTIPTALIPGRDRAHEIVLSCHLDHPSPGANDNASGCAGILEVARTLHRLIADGRLPQPKRSIRFVWPPEVEGTIALLAGRSNFAARTLATIHFDMIGGNTEITKSILRVEGSPPSLPSVVNDVAFALGRFVNEQSLDFASTGAAAMPLIDPEGDKRALQAKVGGFSEGSDHQVWAGGSWRVPVIYIADWPDRYIHTQRDIPANLDATKMKRAIFIGAASAWVLANLDEATAPALWQQVRANQLAATADTLRRADEMKAANAPAVDIANLWRHHFDNQAATVASLGRFVPIPASIAADAARFQADQRRLIAAPPVTQPDPRYGAVYHRVTSLKGPMNGFGYSWFDEHLKAANLPRPAILDREPRTDSANFGDETLNLVDGHRTIEDIRNNLAATSGPVPIEEVAAYLTTLEKLGVIERR